ncbi:hypothetical protein GCM10022626_27220 [[Pseudomonas] carboxydohydrogena]
MGGRDLGGGANPQAGIPRQTGHGIGPRCGGYGFRNALNFRQFAGNSQGTDAKTVCTMAQFGVWSRRFTHSESI